MEHSVLQDGRSVHIMNTIRLSAARRTFPHSNRVHWDQHFQPHNLYCLLSFPFYLLPPETEILCVSIGPDSNVYGYMTVRNGCTLCNFLEYLASGRWEQNAYARAGLLYLICISAAIFSAFASSRWFLIIHTRFASTEYVEGRSKFITSDTLWQHPYSDPW